MENTTTEIVPTTGSTGEITLVANAPKADSLTREDLVIWGKNSLIFSVPAILVVLVALQNGIDPKIAIGMGIQALLAILIGLLKKYSKGV